MTEAAPLLALHDVSKRYRDGRRERTVLADVSLTLEAGTLTTLAGPSGSGKTTLLAILGAMTTPSSGDVRWRGESLVSLRDHHRAAFRAEHVGFVFQDLGLIDSLSLLDNVLLPLVPAGRADRDARARAEAWLDRLGLADLTKSRAGALSGGERQRGAIARALLPDPTLLLLDEPTAHVDHESAEQIVSTLAGLRDEGRAVVASSHDPRFLERPELDRVVRLRDGRVLEI